MAEGKRGYALHINNSTVLDCKDVCKEGRCFASLANSQRDACTLLHFILPLRMLNYVLMPLHALLDCISTLLLVFATLLLVGSCWDNGIFESEEL